MTTRSERLRTGRRQIKRSPFGWTALDFGEDQQILGINYSEWILHAIAVKEAELIKGSSPSGGAIYNFTFFDEDAPRGDLKALEEFYLRGRYGWANYRCTPPLFELWSAAYPGLDREQAEALKEVSAEDMETLLRDIKLLFRSEHVIALMGALQPWETYFSILGESYVLAFDNFIAALSEANADAMENVDKVKDLLCGIFGAAIAALAATVVAVPIIAACAALYTIVSEGAETIGIELPTPEDMLAEQATESGWLNQKLEALFKVPQILHKRTDKHMFLASLIDMLGQIKEQILQVEDVTPDRDVRVILGYVRHQTAFGLKVGLNLNTGQQEDDRPAKRAQDLKGRALVRKARNMLEKAFEFHFEKLMDRLKFPIELSSIGADRASSLPFAAARLELELWRQWIEMTQNGTIKAVDNTTVKFEKFMTPGIKEYLKTLIDEVNAHCSTLPVDQFTEYREWISEGSGLPASQSWWDTIRGAPGTRARAKEIDLLAWFTRHPETDPIHLIKLTQSGFSRETQPARSRYISGALRVQLLPSPMTPMTQTQTQTSPTPTPTRKLNLNKPADQAALQQMMQQAMQQQQQQQQQQQEDEKPPPKRLTVYKTRLPLKKPGV